MTAPVRIFKKKLALKFAALKAFKALKVAKIAKAAIILKNLKKSPIILPVPVALPVGLPSLPQLPQLPKLPEIPNFLNIPSPSLGESLGPIQGFIAGAQQAIGTAGTYKLHTQRRFSLIQVQHTFSVSLTWRQFFF